MKAGGLIGAAFYRAASNKAVRGADGVGAALRMAQDAMERRELCSVCSYCQTDLQKIELAGFDNLTHGICEPCLEAVEQELLGDGKEAGV
jgi:hypothetical protein